MFTHLFALLAQSSSGGGIPWWVWVILIIILLVILWFWFGREEEGTPSAGVTEAVELPEAKAVVESQPQAPAKPDDLKLIEGIGPKVASLLNEAGITSFQQLVEAGAEKLESILDGAGLQMIDAGTWPEQAALAAAGDWEALKKLQAELKGGKHV
jgi:predicted flap endonuclease-1-like 5' DNA nuclease